MHNEFEMGETAHHINFILIDDSVISRIEINWCLINELRHRFTERLPKRPCQGARN